MSAAGAERPLPDMPGVPRAAWDVLATLASEVRAVLDRLGVSSAIDAQGGRLARAIVARALAAEPADGALVVRARVVVADDGPADARSDGGARLVVAVSPGTLLANDGSARTAGGERTHRRALRNGAARPGGAARIPRPRSRPRPAARS